jgi:thiosulfate/3-mercaptopyruvate sulfurtransferase
MNSFDLKKLSRPIALSLVISSAALAAAWTAPAFATEAAVSAAMVNYERDWIVSPKAAFELIQQGALVLDARGADLKKSQGPLANAVPVTWQDLSEPDLPTKGRLIGDANELTKKLQALGVSKGRPIVVVADPVNGWGEDGRVAWSLRAVGHTQVVIADGGLPAIQKIGALAIAPAKVPGDFVVASASKYEIKKEEIKDHLPKKNFAILDVREPREYAGQTPYGESRGGHIPGAQGLWYKDLIDKDGKLLPRAQIEKVLAAKGITKDKDVVAYCTGGIRSGWTTLVLSDLGYKARNYTGSMWEWSAQPAAEYPLQKN